jgi:asparagine synthase (glutamine-hydrolysing)
MPGIFGFGGAIDPPLADKLMADMADALRDEDVYRVESFVSEGVGLGRIHLGIIDQQPQPVWNADSTVALVLQGEIFSWDGLELEKPQTGKELDFSNARLLLAAYEQYGEDFADHVNGTFAAAIWDRREHKLLLVSDVLGSYPLYYAYAQERVVFGAGARAAALAPGLPRAVDIAAVAELVAFEHVYDNKTLFAGVSVVPPGTILRYSEGNMALIQYDDYQHPEYYEMHEESYYIEQWTEYMRQAVNRQARAPLPLGVLLTGGLDSRAILGMLSESGYPIKTLTFGVSDCDDENSASAMARALHLPHKFFTLEPDYLAHLGAKAARITDGLKSSVHCNMIGPLSQIVQEANVLYKGFLGGTIHGYIVSNDRLAPMRDEVWFEHVFDERNRIFKERDMANMYSDNVYGQVRDIPRQSLRKAHARSHSTWWVDRDSYIDLYEEDVRFTIQGVQLARSLALVRTPLMDKDLLRFTMSVPPGYRVNKNYYRRAVTSAFPELAKVPYSGTRRPLDEHSFRELRMRVDEQTRWWLRQRGLHFVKMAQPHPYADYANWMRRQLRPWLEKTLLSPQALNRGYFQPTYIRNLVAEHMAGCDHTRRIGVLLNLELWHRQYMD